MLQSVARQARFEQVGAERLRDVLPDRRDFLARGRETVQVHDGVAGLLLRGLIDPADPLLGIIEDRCSPVNSGFARLDPRFHVVTDRRDGRQVTDFLRRGRQRHRHRGEQDDCQAG